MDSRISSTGILDPSTLDYLRVGGDEVEYGPGATIVRRGEQGRALFIVLAGEVEVRLGQAGGHHLTLCRMGPGSTFGEISILRKVPATADVVTRTAATILEYPAELFPRALSERESLMRKILSRLAHNLHRTTVDAWDLFQKAEALRALVRFEGSAEPMIATSARMRALATGLKILGGCDDPVLLVGEAGAGRTLAARTIHDASWRAPQAVIVVDCARIPPEQATHLLLGSDGSGTADGSADAGAVDVAAGGTLLLRNVEALPLETQRALARHLAEQAGTTPEEVPRTRLMATTRERGDLPPELVAAFRESVEIPALRDRPREIFPLASYFLERCSDQDGRRRSFAPSAEKALVSLRYRYRNVAELQDTVQLAVRCCHGEEIEAEHISAGVGPDDAPLGLPVATAGESLGVLGRGWLSALRLLVLASFLAVIALTIAAPLTAAGRAANGLVWTAWEPAVFALFLLVGPIWCTVCPLSTAARLVQRRVSLGRPLPAWLKSHGIWLAVLGFLAILWVEQVLAVTERPVGTGLLLLALIVAAVGLAVVFRREVWCRYVCPLGRLAATAAPAAPLAMAANRRICSSRCSSHECYRGAGEVPGCTVFHHPQLASQAHNCKLCLDCLYTCPHGATSLSVRAPLGGAFRLASADTYLVPFALAVLLLSPVFLAFQSGRLGAGAGWLTAASAAAVIAAAGLARLLPRVLHGRGDADSPAVPQVALGLAVLGWGPLLAFELGHVPALADLTLVPAPGSGWTGVIPEGVGLLPLLQAGAILSTGIAATVVLHGARRSAGDLSRAGWRLLKLLVLVYLAAGLLLSA